MLNVEISKTTKYYTKAEIIYKQLHLTNIN